MNAFATVTVYTREEFEYCLAQPGAISGDYQPHTWLTDKPCPVGRGEVVFGTWAAATQARVDLRGT